MPTFTTGSDFAWTWIPNTDTGDPDMEPDVQFEIVVDGATVLTKDGPEIEGGNVALRVRFNHDDETWVATLPMEKVKEEDA